MFNDHQYSVQTITYHPERGEVVTEWPCFDYPGSVLRTRELTTVLTAFNIRIIDIWTVRPVYLQDCDICGREYSIYSPHDHELSAAEYSDIYQSPADSTEPDDETTLHSCSECGELDTPSSDGKCRDCTDLHVCYCGDDLHDCGLYN